MIEKLTNRLIQQLSPAAKVVEVYDSELKGFYLRVLPTGTKVFYVRYRLQDGQRHKYKVGRAPDLTVQEAREQAKKILSEVALGANPKANNLNKDQIIPTLKQFIEQEYLPWSESHHQWSKEQVQRLYRMKECLPLPLNEINVRVIEKWRAKRLKQGITSNTVNRDVTGIRSAIAKAVEWGIIEEHPFEKLKPLKVDRSPNIRYLTEDEEKRLRQALDEREAKIREERSSANKWRDDRGYELLPNLSKQPFADHLKPLVLLSLNTGARQGELFRLHWDDVDFDRKSIALVMRGKRKSYTRHIPLNREAFEVLSSWHQLRPDSEKLVFPSKNGQRFDNIQTSWENVKKLANLKSFRWHDMRHHFASKLVMKGVPLNTVRELLGHTNLDMTLRYAHLAPEQKERAVALLDK